MGVSMIGRQNLIPYGILFGGPRFMLFALFRNADTLGEVRYGLACSDIIDCINAVTPLIPLIIYTLLGNTNASVQLYQPTFTIPPVPAPVIQDSNVITRSRIQKFASSKLVSSVVCMPEFRRGATNLIFVFKRKARNVVFHINTPSGAVSRSFLLYREPGAFESNASPVDALMVAPFDLIEVSLTECIGHGASGQVFIGTTNGEMYAIKIAPWKNGKQMLRREAGLYEILSDLQGRCIPKIYGFFGSQHLKALIMAYMGLSVGNISDLSMDQRCAVSSL